MKYLIILILAILTSCTKPNENTFDWVDVSVSNDIGLQCVQMLNSEVGFVGGYPIYYYKETFGTNINNPLFKKDTLILNPDTTLVYRNIEQIAPISDDAFLFKTIDGGKNWQPIVTPFRSGIKKIAFTDELTGYVITRHEGVYKTIDGCNSWVNILENIIYEGSGVGSANPFEGIHFINPREGYIYRNAEPLLFLKTIDGGQSWLNLTKYFSETFQNNAPTQISNIIFPEATETGYAYTQIGIFLTKDAGLNWQKIHEAVEGISFINDSIGFISGYNSKKTTDYGKTWTPIEFQKMESNFIAASEHDFFIASFNGFRAYKISEGQKEYYSMACETNGFINDWQFRTPSFGIAVGSNGLILRYLD